MREQLSTHEERQRRASEENIALEQEVSQAPHESWMATFGGNQLWGQLWGGGEPTLGRRLACFTWGKHSKADSEWRLEELLRDQR
eukprot:872942-Rhodomonas_salina.1